MRTLKWVRLGAAVAAGALIVAGGVASAQERVKVRFGILTTASQAAFYVGTQKGIFQKYGFDVEVKSLATGVQANQALAANQVDWGGGGVESTVVAWANSLPFNVYAMYAKSGDSYGILVRNESGDEKRTVSRERARELEQRFEPVVTRRSDENCAGR